MWSVSSNKEVSKSVHQLVHYHSLVLAYKIRLEKTPFYFDEKFNTQFCRVTRLATEGGFRKNVTNKLTLSQNSFIPRTVDAWNQLPSDIRLPKNVVQFKKVVKV